MIEGQGSGASNEEVEVSEVQIAFVLKQADDGTSVGEVCRKTQINEATFYAWRKNYTGLIPSEIRRLRRELVRMKTERDILKKRRPTSSGTRYRARCFAQRLLCLAGSGA